MMQGKTLCERGVDIGRGSTDEDGYLEQSGEGILDGSTPNRRGLMSRALSDIQNSVKLEESEDFQD